MGDYSSLWGGGSSGAANKSYGNSSADVTLSGRDAAGAGTSISWLGPLIGVAAIALVVSLAIRLSSK